jgi:hypothetical protein
VDELAVAHVMAMVQDETPREVGTIYGRLRKLRAARNVLPSSRYTLILTNFLTYEHTTAYFHAIHHSII